MVEAPEAGFQFDLAKRNAYLEVKGVKPPAPWKTGTTIAGIIFKVRNVRYIASALCYNHLLRPGAPRRAQRFCTGRQQRVGQLLICSMLACYCPLHIVLVMSTATARAAVSASVLLDSSRTCECREERLNCFGYPAPLLLLRL